MATGELSFNSVKSNKFTATFETVGSHSIIVEAAGDYFVVKMIDGKLVIRMNIYGDFRDAFQYDDLKLLIDQANRLMSHPEFSSVKDLWNWFVKSVYDQNANAVFS